MTDGPRQIIRDCLPDLRVAVRDSVNQRRRAEESRLAVIGHGTSGAMIESLTRIDGEGVRELLEKIVEAILPSLTQVTDENSLEQWRSAAEDELDTLATEEIEWSRGRALARATSASLPTALAESIIAVERARCSNLWRRRIDGAIARRRLELRPIYFPDLPIASISEHTVFQLDAGEVGSAQDVHETIEGMYEASDAIWYLYTEAAAGFPGAIEEAVNAQIIRVKETESRFFRHPRYRSSWVKIATPRWDWERELLDGGATEYHRHTLELTTRARMEIAARRANDGPRIELVAPYLWILEDSGASRQGTAFPLTGVGIVTCNHVVLGTAQAFRVNDRTPRAVRVLQRAPLADLAVVEIEGATEIGLPAAISEPASGDRIWIAGFPNYRVGDSGVVHGGVITGFARHDGLPRLLVSAPIIAGMSGSPAMNDCGGVIGVAVTGADRIEEAAETERHGVIPLATLKDLI